MAALNQALRKLFWSDHIQAWQSSGLSQSAYCRNQKGRARLICNNSPKLLLVFLALSYPGSRKVGLS